MQTAPSNPIVIRGENLPSGLRPPALVVSIHDVSTATRLVVDRMIEDLAEAGVGRTSLLVIPDHHHRGRVDESPEFSSWLRQQVSNGHEAVLHGFYHLRPAQAGEGLATRFVTRSYTAGEGEFYDLSEQEASLLLQRGKKVLLGCGVKARGFIAPAWLLGNEAERAVQAEGFEYTTRISSVMDCFSGETYPARSMVYSVRAGWRRALSLLWNEGLFYALKGAPLLRIGLHPPDWEHEAIRSHALTCIRWAAKARSAMSYCEWLDHHRAFRHEGSAD